MRLEPKPSLPHAPKPFLSEPSGTRTRDPLIKSQMLYRPELTAHRGEAGNFNILRALPVVARRGILAVPAACVHPLEN